MAGFLQPNDGLKWMDGHGPSEASTLSDSEKIDLLEGEVLRLGEIVRSLQPLIDQVSALERQAEARETAERRASARMRR